MSAKVEKYRTFKFVVWQESAPSDFLERLQQSFMKVDLILHDKDVYQDETDDHHIGDLKKPHYDGVIMLDGPVTYDRMFRIMKEIAGDGINTIQPCIQTSGALKYICHLTNPEKYQYDPKDVICLNGGNYIADIVRYEMPDEHDDEIIKFIEDHNITQYRTLVLAAKLFNPDWYKGVSGRTLYWKGYLTSKEDTQKNNVKTDIDVLIEEVLKNGN